MSREHNGQSGTRSERGNVEVCRVCFRVSVELQKNLLLLKNYLYNFISYYYNNYEGDRGLQKLCLIKRRVVESITRNLKQNMRDFTVLSLARS